MQLLVTDLIGKLSPSRMDELLHELTSLGIHAGKSIIAAVLIYIIGRWVVKLVNHIVSRFLNRSNIDTTVKTFLGSLVNILLTILLLIAVVSALGVNTTSFAALLASAGVAIGMALSGNLSNFAGGLVILLFKPYKVGDWIEAQNQQGKVMQIQIFHTVIQTVDMRFVYIPNGLMSNAVVVNHDQSELRRVQWIVSIAYGNDVERARELIKRCLDGNPYVVTEPKDKDGNPLDALFIKVDNLSASSVDIKVRVYVQLENYWDLFHQMKEVFYKALTDDPELDIPFNTQTIQLVQTSQEKLQN